MSSMIRPGDLFEDFYRPFGSFFTPLSPQTVAESAAWVPAADIWRSDDGFCIALEIPGLSAQEVEIEAHDNVLTIEGERTAAAETDFLRRERRHGRFVRRFSLPAGTAHEHVSAQVKDGLLLVTIPVAQPSSPQKISVE